MISMILGSENFEEPKIPKYLEAMPFFRAIFSTKDRIGGGQCSVAVNEVEHEFCSKLGARVRGKPVADTIAF
jgi:hypothetical protein